MLLHRTHPRSHAALVGAMLPLPGSLPAFGGTASTWLARPIPITGTVGATLERTAEARFTSMERKGCRNQYVGKDSMPTPQRGAGPMG